MKSLVKNALESRVGVREIAEVDKVEESIENTKEGKDREYD